MKENETASNSPTNKLLEWLSGLTDLSYQVCLRITRPDAWSICLCIRLITSRTPNHDRYAPRYSGQLRGQLDKPLVSRQTNRWPVLSHAGSQFDHPCKLPELPSETPAFLQVN